jgi:predicted nucleotidyltransferase
MLIKLKTNFGLRPGEIEAIVAAITKYGGVETAVIFGSRAMGNYKPTSDVDIAIISRNCNIASKISFELNQESMMPYQFDIIDYNTLTNQNLKASIDQNGILIFKARI